MMADTRMNVACRRILIEYGRTPISPWLDQISTISSLHALQRELLQRGQLLDDGTCLIDPESLSEILDISPQQCSILLDLFAAVTDDTSDAHLKLDPETLSVKFIDAHRLVLFLLTHLYCCDAERGDTSDVWPLESFGSPQMGPSSPMYLTTRAYAATEVASAASLSTSPSGKHHRWHLPSTRQHMHDHLLHIEAVIKGFGPWISRHADEIAKLIAQRPPSRSSTAMDRSSTYQGYIEDSDGVSDDDMDLLMDEDNPRVDLGGDIDQGSVYDQTSEHSLAKQTPVGSLSSQSKDSLQLSVREVDRLGFLLQDDNNRDSCWDSPAADVAEQSRDVHSDDRNAMAEHRSCNASPRTSVELSHVGASGIASNHVEEKHESVGDGFSACLPAHLWHRQEEREDKHLPVSSLAQWIRQQLANEKETHASDISNPDVSMLGVSPPRGSVFNALVPPTLSLLLPRDIHAAHRTTVICGEKEMGSNPQKEPSTISMVDCHDSVVYCLAPLLYATVSGCSDCVIVLGAIGRAIHVTHCERVQIMAVAKTLIVETCRDCIFYVGVNRPPILVGDNRFLQLAPHNAGYEYLSHHMTVAGVEEKPNYWSHASSLAHHACRHEEMHAKSGSHGRATAMPIPFSSVVTGNDPTLDKASEDFVSAGGEPMEEVMNSRTSEGPYAPSPVTLLPPSKLVPFSVPFRGGPGPLCGGPASPESVKWPVTSINLSDHGDTNTPSSSSTRHQAVPSDDPFSGLLSRGDDPGMSAFKMSPFALPPLYASAWSERMNGFVKFRNLYRAAGLNDGQKVQFMSTVQATFRDWLHSIGCMREIYDLARAEREIYSSDMKDSGKHHTQRKD